MNIKLTNENIKLFIFLALLPIFVFAVSVASRAIYAVDEFAPPVYEANEEDNIKMLKILNSNVPARTIATFRVEIASSQEEQVRGLSGRKSLLKNRGMFFVFPAPDNYSFWMKDMNFGLDFIWINGDIVVEITPDVMPFASESLDVFVSKEKADKVLEVNAGTVKRLGIKVGNKIEIN